MRKYLWLLLLIPTLAIAEVDTFEGEAVTTDTEIEGCASCDTSEGQAVTAGGNNYKTNLLGSYDFDAASNPFNDQHTTANHLTNNGADDVSGGHDFVGGSNDYAEGLGSGAIDEDLAISIFLRFNPDDTSNWERIIHFKDDDTGIMVARNGVDMYAVPGNDNDTDTFWSNSNSLFGDDDLTEGSWNTVVAVFSSGTEKTMVRMCVNGVAETTTDGSDDWGSGADGDELYLGAYRTGASAPDGTYDGLISDFSIWNRELSAAECTDLHTNYDYSGW